MPTLPCTNLLTHELTVRNLLRRNRGVPQNNSAGVDHLLARVPDTHLSLDKHQLPFVSRHAATAIG
jgi:hypothetical protein